MFPFSLIFLLSEAQCNLRVLYIWLNFLIAAGLGLLYIWKLWTLLWHKTRLHSFCVMSQQLWKYYTLLAMLKVAVVTYTSLRHLKHQAHCPNHPYESLGKCKPYHLAVYLFCSANHEKCGIMYSAVIWEVSSSLL